MQSFTQNLTNDLASNNVWSSIRQYRKMVEFSKYQNSLVPNRQTEQSLNTNIKPNFQTNNSYLTKSTQNTAINQTYDIPEIISSPSPSSWPENHQINIKQDDNCKICDRNPTNSEILVQEYPLEIMNTHNNMHDHSNTMIDSTIMLSNADYVQYLINIKSPSFSETNNPKSSKNIGQDWLVYPYNNQDSNSFNMSNLNYNQNNYPNIERQQQCMKKIELNQDYNNEHAINTQKCISYSDGEERCSCGLFQEIERLKKEYEKIVDESNLKDQQISNLTEEYKIVENQLKESKALIIKIRKENSKRLKEIEIEFKTKIDNLNQIHTKELENLKNTLEMELYKKEEEYNILSEMLNLRENQQTNGMKIEKSEEYEEEIRSMKTEFGVEIEKLHKFYQVKINKCKEENSRLIYELQEKKKELEDILMNIPSFPNSLQNTILKSKTTFVNEDQNESKQFNILPSKMPILQDITNIFQPPNIQNLSFDKSDGKYTGIHEITTAKNKKPSQIYNQKTRIINGNNKTKDENDDQIDGSLVKPANDVKKQLSQLVSAESNYKPVKLYLNPPKNHINKICLKKSSYSNSCSTIPEATYSKTILKNSEKNHIIKSEQNQLDEIEGNISFDEDKPTMNNSIKNLSSKIKLRSSVSIY